MHRALKRVFNHFLDALHFRTRPADESIWHKWSKFNPPKDDRGEFHHHAQLWRRVRNGKEEFRYSDVLDQDEYW